MVKEVLAPNAKNRIEKLKANSVEGFEKNPWNFDYKSAL